MSVSAPVIALYEETLSLTLAMLGAASKGDWDGLVQLERDRSKLVDQIKAQDPDPMRDPQTRGRKREIMEQILRHDEQIQLLTQDWMHELREILGSVSQEHRLHRTYGPR